jgi:DNA-binding response OmpR family regulator
MELMARIEALLRRSGGPSSVAAGHARFGDVRVNLRSHTATRGGTQVALSPVEFRLLEYLLARRGDLVTREELLKGVWSLEGDTLSRTVDVHVAGLRKKIEAYPRYPRFLVTVKGIGYKLAM